MIDPSVPLQRALFAALRQDALLVAWFASADRETPAEAPRVFDRIPRDEFDRPDVSFPYIHIGADDDQVLDGSDSCHPISECFANVHCWSRALGSVEAKELAAHVARILDAEIAVEGFSVITHRIEKTVGVPERDGLTKHRVVTPVYELSPT